MMNKVVLIGRLTREPEVRKTASGLSNCSFSVAVNRNFKNAQGQYDADFINCVAWRQTADYMGTYLHKGNLVSVEGRLSTRNYDDPKAPGRKVYVTEVTVENISGLESRATSEARANNNMNNSYYPDDNYSDMAAPSTFDISADDDLPF